MLINWIFKMAANIADKMVNETLKWLYILYTNPHTMMVFVSKQTYSESENPDLESNMIKIYFANSYLFTCF